MKMKNVSLEIDSEGWYNQAECVPSSNFDARPKEISIDLLVIHNISLPPAQYDGNFISELFCNNLDFDADPYFGQLRQLRVSAHFLIRRDGALQQFVSANDRAWHAGTSIYAGRERCNDFSIGIELEGTDTEPFSHSQYEVLAQLTHALQQRYLLTDIAGHSHIAPMRKTDPGPHFEWGKYRTLLKKLDPSRESALRFPQT